MGVLSVPLLMLMSEALSVPFYTLIKLCYTKALEGSRVVPIPKAKSSSEIMNLTPFTINYHPEGLSRVFQDKVRTLRAPACLFSQYTCFLLYLTNSMVCLCEWITHPAQSEHWALLCSMGVPGSSPSGSRVIRRWGDGVGVFGKIHI